MLSREIKLKLLSEGIHEDVVKALDEKGNCLFDLNGARDLCFELIDMSVKFSFEQSILDNGLYLIKILN